MDEQKNEAWAANAIQMIARGTKQASARLAIARAAVGPHGNYTPAAKAMWQEYLNSGAPKA